MSHERTYTADEIEGVMGGALGGKLLADGCRDMAKWDTISNYSAVCIIPGIVQAGFTAAATWLEVTDDVQTSERIDAIGMCMRETTGQIQQVKTNLQSAVDLLREALGQRPDYPTK